MRKWIFEFVREVDTIDCFFIDKLQEFVQKFIEMQKEFLKKIQNQREGGRKNGGGSEYKKYVSPIDGTDIDIGRSAKNVP